MNAYIRYIALPNLYDYITVVIADWIHRG